MNYTRLAPAVLGLCALTFTPAQAQQSSDQNEDEIVRLSPFEVEERADIGRYQASGSTSGSRVRTDLMDMTQSVSVVTNEFLNDLVTGRMSEAMRYVAGVQAVTESNALDGMYVRGFSVGSITNDGFSLFSWVPQDPIVVDRVEIVKGPNAILSPQGLPGGLLNYISKKAKFTENKGYASYQIGRWDANRAEFDQNYVVKPNKLAVRLVAAYTDAEDYAMDNFHQNMTVMPMFTWRITPKTELSAQVELYNARVAVDYGSPISLYAIGKKNLHVQDGIPRHFSYMGKDIARHQSGQVMRFFLNSQLTDRLSMRIVGNWSQYKALTNYLAISTPNIQVIDLDHITGEWYWDGVKTNDNPTYTIQGQGDSARVALGNLQNDYSYEYIGQGWKSQTVAGFAVNYKDQDYKFKVHAWDPTIYDLRNYTPPRSDQSTPWITDSTSWDRSVQIYAAQVFNLFDNRLIVNGSLSHTRQNNAGKNNMPAPPPPPPGNGNTEPPFVPPEKNFTLPSVGFVYKVTPEVALYYGYTRQELPGQEDRKSGIPRHTIPSRQHEGGLRLRLFDGKLYATFAYFDILQENLVMPNWGNYIAPRPDPLLPSILSQRTVKGTEFEFIWAMTKQLSVLGNYTKFKNRDLDDQPYAGAAEESASLWTSYSFSEGPLNGLWLGLGMTYTGERPADATGGTSWMTHYTEPPPGYDPVRIQPSWVMPSYVIWEASASYRFKKHWEARLLLRNLFNKDYVSGAFLRMMTRSTPFNPKFTLTYEF